MVARKEFKTGEICEITGRYRFLGYVDGTSTPPPHPKERRISIVAGQTFPLVESSGKDSCWRLIVQ